MNVAARSTGPEALIARWRHLPGLTARRYASHLPRALDYDDLVSAGNIGLCKAAESFDPSRGAKFVTFAIAKIRGAMLEEFRQWDLIPRSAREKHKRDGAPLPTVVSLETSVLCTLGATGDARFADVIQDEAEGPETLAMRADAHSVLRQAVERLPDRERDLMRRYYDGNQTFRQIAEAFGISESRVYQVHQQAVRRLRRDERLLELCE